MIYKFTLVFLGVSIAIGLYPNVLLSQYGLYLLDFSVLLIFIQSVFMTHYRVKSLDLFLLLFFTLNILLLLINFKLLLDLSSLLYLIRFCIYFATYPFFIYLQKNFPNFTLKTLILFLFMAVISNLLIFFLFPNLNINGFDPHKNRLYGQFLDPNYYAVFLIVNTYLVINFYDNKCKLILLPLLILSVFLTVSRLGLLSLFLLVLLNYAKKYSWYLVVLIISAFLLSLLNSNILSRLLFIEGNLDSFLYRLFDLMDGVLVYINFAFPSGFNNMGIYNNYLTSNSNNASSYYDFWPLNLVLSGGVVLVGIVSLSFINIGQKIKNIPLKKAIFILVMSSFAMNILFFPVFILYFSSIIGIGLFQHKK